MLLLSTSVFAAAPTPWYAHAECKAAHREVMTLEISRVEVVIDRLKRHRDIELRACGYWLEIPRSTAELVLRGKRKISPEDHERRLKILHAFGMRFGKKRPHLRDLAIEARMRRVRLLLETGKKTDALEEARRVEKMLASRAQKPTTASRTYVRGAIDLVVGESAWPVRTLLSMAGVEGDSKRGRTLLESLAKEDTVYRSEAGSVLYHFARENHGSRHARTQRYGRMLAAEFPENPQFGFDHGVDLVRLGKPAQALQRIEPAYRRLLKEPELWTSRLRKRIEWLTARAAFDCGQSKLAHEARTRAEKERYGGYKNELDILSKDMGS